MTSLTRLCATYCSTELLQRVAHTNSQTVLVMSVPKELNGSRVKIRAYFDALFPGEVAEVAPVPDADDALVNELTATLLERLFTLTQLERAYLEAALPLPRGPDEVLVAEEAALKATDEAAAEAFALERGAGSASQDDNRLVD